VHLHEDADASHPSVRRLSPLKPALLHRRGSPQARTGRRRSASPASRACA
jgi:hypothetical protein